MEKKTTAAITVPQIRETISLLLNHKLNNDHPEQICRNRTRRLQRNEQARFHHYKSRNLLAPKRIDAKT